MEKPLSFYDLADDFSLLTNRCIFLTGKAGTGKTTFLRRLREKTSKQMAVVAPTGVAAINAGGTTIHSFFQLSFTPFIPTDEARKNLIAGAKMRAERRRVLYELELLVIDEISMVRADVLDEIDTMLRHFKYRFNEPFGGVQVIFIGDLFQLSPVVQDAEWHILSPYYAGCYFFQSKVMEQLHPVYIELDKVFRQPNADFVALLNQVRNNCLSAEGLAQLNSLYQQDYKNSADDFHITLTTHNAKADRMNADALKKLKGKSHCFMAKVRGEFQERNYPTDEKLELKIGARVMFVKNDEAMPCRFYNGKIGIVTRFDEDAVVVTCPEDDVPISVTPMEWKNIRYTADEQTKHILEEELGSFTQYPLRLAWAITIHKSQGLTFDKVVIDAGDAFAPGQVYVALSRCRTLEGLVLLSRIQTDSLINAREVLQYGENRSTLSELETLLSVAKADFRLQLFAGLFDFRKQQGQVEHLAHIVKESASFNDLALKYLDGLQLFLYELQPIGVKFQAQLAGLLSASPVNEAYLGERMRAAVAYFGERLDSFMERQRQSPAQTDVKSHAREFDEAHRTLFFDVAQKKWLMCQLTENQTVTHYFEARANFMAPSFRIKAYAGDAQIAYVTSENPEVLQALLDWRNCIFRASGKRSLRSVIGTELLQTIADKLPRNMPELRQIKGFGKAKADLYGMQLLRLLNDYRKMSEDERPLEEEKLPEKRAKGDSAKVSLEMYRQGMDVSHIAEERHLAVGTIVTHLCVFLHTGEVKLSDLLSDEKRAEALKIIHKPDLEGDEKSTLLRDSLTPTELSVFYTWLRMQS